jgi:Fe-S cluster assembly protein SufD
LQENIDFKYLLIANDADINIEFITQWTNVKWDVFAILFGDKPLSANIISHIHSSSSHINMFLLSFISTDKMMDIQGSIDLWKDIFNAQWHLLEKNVILSKKGAWAKIRAIPRLDVYSNDVQASHGVSIDRINEDNLFYLSSKWLDNDSSQELIIKWYIQNILQKFTELSDTDRWDLETKILSQIIKND